jgi:hypothetical protein
MTISPYPKSRMIAPGFTIDDRINPLCPVPVITKSASLSTL